MLNYNQLSFGHVTYIKLNHSFLAAIIFYILYFICKIKRLAQGEFLQCLLLVCSIVLTARLSQEK